MTKAVRSRCAAPRCMTSVRHGMLMCPRHWRQVPLEIQKAVWSTWRRVQREGLSVGWDAYSAAVKAAQEAVV